MEMIELTNDGKGLGFGIIGGRSTGVMVKTILPGGAAGRVNPPAKHIICQSHRQSLDKGIVFNSFRAQYKCFMI